MKKLLSTVLAVMVIVPALFASADYYGYGQNYYNGYGDASFYDVPNSYPYYDSIYWMRDNQFVSGYSDGNFRPDICVNRAEFLKMMFEVANTEDDVLDYPYYNTVHYSDVFPGDWFYPYVVEATYQGVVRGYEDGSFKPGNCVTRAEAIKMASLYFNDGDLPEIDEYQFRIVDNNFRKWFYPFVDYASRSNTVGLYHAIPARSIDEVDAFYYLPEESMTRGEVAEMLYRLEYITDRNDDVYEGGRRDYDSDRVISCEIDIRDNDFDPTYENLRIDFETDTIGDMRLEANITAEDSYGNVTKIRTVRIDSNDDYTYYWDGEDENNDVLRDGRWYTIEISVVDLGYNWTCSDSERVYIVSNGDVADNSDDSDNPDSDSDDSNDTVNNDVDFSYSDDDTVNYNYTSDYNYSDDDTTNYTYNYNYDYDYYYSYYYADNSDNSTTNVDNSDNSTTDNSSTDNSDNSTTNNDDSTTNNDNSTGDDSTDQPTDDDDLVVLSCDISLSSATFDPSDETLVISYGIGDYTDAMVNAQIRFIDAARDESVLVNRNLNRNTNHVYYWTGNFPGAGVIADGGYEVQVQLRDIDTNELICSDRAKLNVSN